MNVLIVEEQSSTILDLKSTLSQLGHNVVAVASTGKEAIEYAGNLNPDFIIINIKLKGRMGGVEAAQEIESLYKIPCIFFTVFIKNCLNKSLRMSEDAIVLSLPLKPDHLEYAIKRVLSDE